MKKIGLIVMLLVLALSCLGAGMRSGAPMNSALGAAETLKGLKMVVNGASGTFVMAHGDQYLLAWPYKGQYAIAMIGEGSVRGLRQGPMPLSELVKALEAAGWKFTSPAGLPTAVVSALGAYSLEMAIVGMQSLPSVFILPVGMLTPVSATVQQ